MLHVSRAGRTQSAKRQPKKAEIPKLQEFIEKHDFLGAVTLLEFQIKSGEDTNENYEWLAYAYSKTGDYVKAQSALDVLIGRGVDNQNIRFYWAVCLLYMGEFEKAIEATANLPESKELNRLEFHLAHRLADEDKLLVHHQQLDDIEEDQLSLSAVHYLRGHYQEAIDVYKRLLNERPEWVALNVFIALCYYKLDYYDVSLEVLQEYLQHFPDSAVTVNLKACNNFRLYNGKSAEDELKPLKELLAGNPATYGADLIRHNTVVFRYGDGALQTLPPLVDAIPEARLNLVIFHLRTEDYDAAYDLVKDMEPSNPQEYIIKGVVNLCMGYHAENGTEFLKQAQNYLHLVGTSASECDTIPGRQCMAACFFLLKKFDDVMVYLNSIQSYVPTDDDFLWNLGMVKSQLGEFEDALESLTTITTESLKNEFSYQAIMTRCLVMTGRPRDAWDLYLGMSNSQDAYAILQIIANDCYEMGAFYYSAKAFDVIERLDPSNECWEGKRGACVGVFQQIVAKQEPEESLPAIIALLRNTNNPQVEYIVKVMQKWAQNNGIEI